ncbi:hypothetical protein E3N88_20017 [Mikania micrantha]|uniref:Uncharacterized protein n=1 Tax=Mikania micrantha TaxID=192012 RepID=A0A5N6NGA2_9ASTR|nr:hypothetical protein E3N88_20017 [Mikania micrantha]
MSKPRKPPRRTTQLNPSRHAAAVEAFQASAILRLLRSRFSTPDYPNTMYTTVAAAGGMAAVGFFSITTVAG